MIKNKSLVMATFLVVMTVMVLGATGAAAGTIRIGITGRMVDTVSEENFKMIVDELELINAAGGINGNKVEVTLLNDECKSDKGVANANKLIYQHKVHLLIGSTCSSVTLPIVDVTAKAKVPHITPHSTNHMITMKGSAWIFRVPISSRFYKATTAAYVAKNIGTKVAYIYASDAAAEGFVNEMIKWMKANHNVDPVLKAKVQAKEIDFRTPLLKAKAAKPDALVIAGQDPEMARGMAQSYEVGIPRSVARVGSSAASNATFAIMAGDAAKGVFYSAAYTASDTRSIAKLFNRLTAEKYGQKQPDHNFAQAYDLVRIVEIALNNAELKLTDDSLAADRTAIRDALASVKDYQGLASGPISFCADATPQCRDGNRTPVLIEYVEGGENHRTRKLGSITFDADFGLDAIAK